MILWERQTNGQLQDIVVGLREGVLGVLRAWKRGADHYLCYKQGSGQTW